MLTDCFCIVCFGLTLGVSALQIPLYITLHFFITLMHGLAEVIMDNGNIPSEIADITTPCFLVDVNRLKKNADRMLETCRKLKVDLRCHTKTHKTV